MLKSLTIKVLLSTSPFQFINNCFICLGTPMLAACTFINVLSSHWIHLVIVYVMPFFVFYTVLALISFFSDMNIDTPAFFSFPFEWSIFNPFTVSLFMSVILKLVSYGLPWWLRQQRICLPSNLGLIPAWGRSPGGGHGNPLQYSCLENPHGQSSLVSYSPWGCKELDIDTPAFFSCPFEWSVCFNPFTFSLCWFFLLK